MATSAESSRVAPLPAPALDLLLFEILGTPAGRRDPYSRYSRLREERPLHRTGLGLWVSTTFDQCQFVLRDPRFAKGEIGQGQLPQVGIGEDQLAALRRRRSLLFLNPPDHTRLRRLVSRAFTPRTVERLRPAIEASVDALLSEITPGEPFDVLTEIASPLPVAVIGGLLGVPVADRARFQATMHQATLLLEPVLSNDQLEVALAAESEVEQYFRALVAERRRHPGDDLISGLVAVAEGGDTLSEEEIISTASLLFGAGFETTTNLIANGMLALLEHPDELTRVRENVGLVPSAVEELLRFDSPVQIDGRTAFADVPLGDCVVAEGDEVLTILGAANRDPARFSDPDRLDLARDEGGSLAFGSGIHLCLGAALARAEGEVVFSRLLERFETWELAGEVPTYRNRITLRGLEGMQVALS